MDVRTPDVEPSSSCARRRSEVRRSLKVSAKLALCLQPEFDQVSVAVAEPAGRTTIWAEDGALAAMLHQVQMDLDEGPSIDSLRTGERFVVPHLQHDDRWPRFGRAAARLGLRSQISAPVRWRSDAPVGTLTMYSTTHAHVGISAPLVAEVIASQMASALTALVEIETLQAALDTRTMVEQATGLAMGHLGVDAEHASSYLRRVSMIRDLNLTRVAEELVRTRELPSVRPA